MDKGLNMLIGKCPYCEESIYMSRLKWGIYFILDKQITYRCKDCGEIFTIHQYPKSVIGFKQENEEYINEEIYKQA